MQLIQSTNSQYLILFSSFLHHRYAIDRRTDMDHLFNVHSGNGSVFLLKSMDREEAAWHNISVIATELRKSRGRARLFAETFAEKMYITK